MKKSLDSVGLELPRFWVQRNWRGWYQVFLSAVPKYECYSAHKKQYEDSSFWTCREVTILFAKDTLPFLSSISLHSNVIFRGNSASINNTQVYGKEKKWQK